jgi:Zn-dependent peptidase ImmA (M78 family)
MANIADGLRQLDVDPERLSKRTGISKERVDAILRGVTPTASELRLIAKYVRLPANALVKLNLDTPQGKIRFRATMGGRKELRITEARIGEIEQFLTRYGLLGDRTLSPRLDARYVDRDSIEDAAISIRALICSDRELLDPICDLPERLDRAGIARVLILKELNVEGAATIHDGRNLIIVAGRTFAPRMLFTCAHELAHIVLGHIQPGDWLLDDEAIESFTDQREDERICNALASAILLPAQGLGLFLKEARATLKLAGDGVSSTEILYLARYFGTSFLTAAMRLEYLSILPPGGGFSIEESIRRDYKSVENFAQTLGLPPRTPIKMSKISETIRNNLAAALSDGVVSIGRAAETFGLSTFELAHALA